MPPKRKTTSAKKTQKKVETEVKVKTTVEAPDAETKIEQTSIKRKHSEIVEEEETEEPQEQESQEQESQEQESQEQELQEQEPQEKQARSEPSGSRNSGSSSSLSDRMAKLKELKRRRATEVDQGNRRDRNLEFQRSKENPKLEARDERKKAEALKLLEKQEAEDKGEDYERKQFWKYSAESAAAWEKKMAKKAKMANNGFTDHSQAAHKKYIRLMSEFKPDMGAYTEKRMLDIERAIRNGEDPSDISAMANSLDYARLDDKPSKEAVDRLAEETKKQIQQRETRSRDRKEQPDDISWINEKNRVFNQKIARFYDKYTKEIRENLERGTAL
ncbi:MFS domain-containing protein [Mucor velutinosus]|uniref:Pre-mRNA-splicing factor SYF2 n=1 Tax=Mucor velutinosus TaxID=708070 RepID=A0AAN7HSV0_9FUNG|nr:MFS domain-containing protein [Mucor velutinosus]